MRKLANDELNRISAEDFKKALKLPLVIVLDNLRSMHNVGSVFRTADAFLIEKIFLCGITATPPHREIYKTALGATESVAWEYVSDPEHCVLQLKKQGYHIVSVEQTDQSIMLQDFYADFIKEKYALVFGNEMEGVSEKVIASSDFSIEIPQFGTKHSLNIAVSAGMVIWEFCRSYIKSGMPVFDRRIR
jgi:tRNA G18 (ribose-2'-O)-methylase SpoU